MRGDHLESHHSRNGRVLYLIQPEISIGDRIEPGRVDGTAGSQGSLQALDPTLEYLGTMAVELSSMASAGGDDTLASIFRLAVEEVAVKMSCR